MNKQELLIELKNKKIKNNKSHLVVDRRVIKNLINLLNDFDDKYDLLSYLEVKFLRERNINDFKIITEELDKRSLFFTDEVLNHIKHSNIDFTSYHFVRNKKEFKEHYYGSNSYSLDFITYLYNLQEQLKREDGLKAKLIIKEETVKVRRKI